MNTFFRTTKLYLYVKKYNFENNDVNKYIEIERSTDMANMTNELKH